MNRFAILMSLLTVISCSRQAPCVNCSDCGEDLNYKEPTLEEFLVQSKAVNVQTADSLELKESIKKIEKKYGAQWDFCDCVVKGDSITKAFSKPDLPDDEFNRLSDRFDEIDRRCQSFRIQDASRTPEQREAHERRVRKCLREAGIKL